MAGDAVSVAQLLPGLELGAPVWQRRRKSDPAACALADRHYSRGRVGAGQVGPPGRLLVFVTPCERAAWITHWPAPELAMDGLDAWRCSMFRNEGAGLSSDLIRAAMDLIAQLWTDRPADGWATWVEVDKVRRKRDPGRCFLRAGWHVDRKWRHPKLIRLRAPIEAGAV